MCSISWFVDSFTVGLDRFPNGVVADKIKNTNVLEKILGLNKFMPSCPAYLALQNYEGLDDIHEFISLSAFECEQRAIADRNKRSELLDESHYFSTVLRNLEKMLKKMAISANK